jgi:hypothetical protein
MNFKKVLVIGSECIEKRYLLEYFSLLSSQNEEISRNNHLTVTEFKYGKTIFSLWCLENFLYFDTYLLGSSAIILNVHLGEPNNYDMIIDNLKKIQTLNIPLVIYIHSKDTLKLIKITKKIKNLFLENNITNVCINPSNAFDFILKYTNSSEN